MPKAVVKKKLGIPRGKQSGPLSDLRKEMIWQAFLISGNKSEVAREFEVCIPTVTSVIRNFSKQDTDLREAKTAALGNLSGRIHKKTNELLESIGEKDLERAALSQKSVSVGIFVDKLGVLQKQEDNMRQTDVGDSGLLLPNDAAALLSMARGQIKRLGIMQVEFENQPAVVSEIQDSLAAAQAAMEAEATVVDVEDLDP